MTDFMKRRSQRGHLGKQLLALLSEFLLQRCISHGEKVPGSLPVQGGPFAVSAESKTYILSETKGTNEHPDLVSCCPRLPRRG